MKKTLSFLLLLAAAASFAQIKFESGYFVANNGKKTQCLIKNIAWKNNPVGFEYKLSENDEAQTASINHVTEFSVIDAYKYKRYTVDIDRSSSDTDRMSDQKEPIWKKETLFLKVLVEGKASLYQYEDGNLVRYFFSTGDHTKAEQLVFKEYRFSGQIGQNNLYRQQLYNALGDRITNKAKFTKAAYRKKDLVDLFLEYNSADGEVKNLSARQNKGSVNLKVTPGVSLASFNIKSGSPENNIYRTSYKSGGDVAFRIGLELEYVLPFNNNKWSIFIDPNVQFFNHSGTDTREYFNTPVTYEWEAKYNYIELPVGVRHYMYLNDKSRLFADVSAMLSLPFGDPYIQYNLGEPMEITRSSNFAIGAGYSFDNRYSAELRYSFGRGLLDSGVWSAGYNYIGIVLGYKLF